ncbi:VOC family protein, partial [Streptomyces roseolus]
RLGGRVAEPPVDTPYGRIAVLHDNQGARFAVLAEPVPAEPLDAPGEPAALSTDTAPLGPPAPTVSTLSEPPAEP